MMRKLTSILFLALVLPLYAVENVTVDSKSRDVLNTGAINFAPLQLTINGVAVVPGGGGGVGGGVNSISISFPVIFGTPLSFTDDGSANWSANATLSTQPSFTFFGNGTSGTDVPTFMNAGTAKLALGLSHVNDTADADKPISTAQATVNSANATLITGNTADIATINTTLGNLKLSTIAAPTADVSLAGFRIINLGTPTGGTDAATKDYVDTAANVGPPHPVVAVASTGNLTLSGEQTIDGVTTSASRILVKNQTTATQNGIYVTAAGAWSRAADANTGTSVSGVVFVSGGTTQTATSWGVTTPQPITLGTTSIAYTLTGTGGTTYTNGTGLSLSGNQFSLAPIATGNVLGNNSGGSAAPTAQPATTVGFNFLGLTNPSAITFPRINADNTVTARSAANFLSDIGAGTVTSVGITTNNATDLLTYSITNSTTTPGFTINKASVTGASVYGTSATGNPTFMSAATARGALGGTTVGQNLFTLANPGGSGVTFPRFNNDNTISALTGSSFLTSVGASPVDAAVLFGDTGGTTGTPFTWTAGATAGLQTVAMTTDHYVLLPPASGYAPGKRIIYTDTVTTGSFGMFFRRSGTDTLNGGTADFRPFIAGNSGAFSNKSVEFEDVAGTGWQVVTTAGNAFKVQDPLDATKSFIFGADNQTSGVQGKFAPAGGSTTSVSVIPSSRGSDTTQAVTGIGTDGSVQLNSLAVVPDPGGHGAGESLQVQSDGTFAWSLPSAGASAYQILDSTVEPIQWNCVAGKTTQNAVVTLGATPASTHTIAINGANSGNNFHLIVRQDSTGGRTIVGLPTGSLVENTGAGLPTISTGANAVSELNGTYSGVGGVLWLWTQHVAFTGNAVTACNTLSVTGGTSTGQNTAQNLANRTSLSSSFIAADTQVCRVDLTLFKTNAPSYDMKVYIVPDGIAKAYTTGSTTSGSNVVILGGVGVGSEVVGQAITGDNIPASSYVGSLDTTTDPSNYRVTVVDARTGGAARNATGTATGTAHVNIWGVPGTTALNAAGSDPVNAVNVTTTTTGQDYSFTSVGATGMTVGALYHVVMISQTTFGTVGVWDASNYVTWIGTVTSAPGGYSTRKASTKDLTGAWSLVQPNRKLNFKTFKP